MHFVVETSYDLGNKTALIVFSLGGVEATRFTWTGQTRDVTVAPRIVASVFNAEELASLIKEIDEWMNQIRVRFGFLDGILTPFDYQLTKRPTEVELKGTIAGIPVDGRWEPEGQITLLPRPGGTINWADFKLFIDVHRKLAEAVMAS